MTLPPASRHCRWGLKMTHAYPGDPLAEITDWRDAAERCGFPTKQRAGGGFNVRSDVCHPGGDNPQGVWVALSETRYPQAHCHKCPFPASDANFRRNVGLPEFRSRGTSSAGQPSQRAAAPPGPSSTDATAPDPPFYDPRDPLYAPANLVATYRHPSGLERPVYRRDCGGPDCPVSKCDGSVRKHIRSGTTAVRGYLPLVWRPDAESSFYPVWGDGEKTAAAIRDAGFYAISTLQGHGSAHLAAWPDAPEPGAVRLVQPDNTSKEVESAHQFAQWLADHHGWTVGVYQPVGEPESGDDLADLSPEEIAEHLLAMDVEWYEPRPLPEQPIDVGTPAVAEPSDVDLIINCALDRMILVDGLLHLKVPRGTWASFATNGQILRGSIWLLLADLYSQVGIFRRVSMRAVHEVIAALGALATVSDWGLPRVASVEMNRDPVMILASGGGLDLRNGHTIPVEELYGHLLTDRGDGVTYDPEALAHDPGDWGAWALDHYGETLWRRFAYNILAGPRKEIDAAVLGVSDAGKGTVYELLRMMFGQMVTKVYGPKVFTGDRFASYAVRMVESRLTLIDECDKIKAPIGEAEFNELTEGMMTIEYKGKDRAEFPRTASPFFIGAAVPPIEGGQGTANRMSWVYDGDHVPAMLAVERQNILTARVAAYMLAWSVRECQRMYATGETGATTATLDKAMETARGALGDLAKVAVDSFVLDPGEFMTYNEARTAMKKTLESNTDGEYSSSAGDVDAIANQTWHKLMVHVGPEVKTGTRERGGRDSKRRWGIAGIRAVDHV